jgi:hypothetical protein
VLLALAVALLFGLPHLLMWAQLRAQGRPYCPLVVDHVTAVTYDETTYYAPRVHDLYDGHPFTADPAGWEYKQATAFAGVGALPPLLLAPLTYLGHGDVGAVFAACDFLLPPLLFLALLWLGAALEIPFWVATAGALLLLIAHDQITLPFALLAHPRWSVLADSLHLTASYRPVEYSRLTIPQLGYAFVVLAILGLYRTGERPRLGTGILTAVALGALFYTYVFFWTWVMAGAGVYAALLLIQRRPRAALAVGGAALGGCLLGAPVLWQGFSSGGYVGQAFLEARQTWGGKVVNFAHHKHELGVWAVLLALFPWRDRRFPLFVSFLLAPYLCIAAARLAHQSVQEWHWFGRCWYPWMALVLPVAFWARVAEPCRQSVCRRVRPWVRAHLLGPVIGAVVVFCFAYGLNDHVRYGLSMAPYYTLTTDEQAAYAWLRANAPRDAVVAAADCNVLALVPVYTQCNSYLPYCLITPAPDEELMERFWIIVRLLRLNESAVRLFLTPERHTPEGFWWPHRWWMVNWLFHTRYGELTVPPAVQRQMEKVRAIVDDRPLDGLLTRYRLDYVWVDNVIGNNFCDPRPYDLPYLRPAFQSGEVTLYAVERGGARSANDN